MACTMDARELRQQYDLLGPRRAVKYLSEALNEKELRPEDFSIRDLFEGLVDGGEEMVRLMDPRRKSGGLSLVEATNAVDTSAFSNITGQIIYNKMLEGYMNPAFLYPDLMDTMTTVFLDNERLPGVGGSGDLGLEIAEGEPYPLIGLNEEYVDFGPTAKHGFEIDITREMVVADRTGLVLNRSSESGHYMGVNLEKRGMNVVTGQTGYNTYKRNTVNTNTFLTSGAYINSYAANANLLVSWRSLENAELLFDGITDPNTGEPILVEGEMVLLVPSALKMTAHRIVNVETVGAVDNTASAATVRQYGPNPLKGGLINATGVKVLTNAYVKNATSSTTQWFWGQPKRAFLRRIVWDIETQQAPDNSEASFTRDILMRYRFGTRDQIGIQNPRFWTLNQ